MPNIIGAIAFLVLGWVFALLISSVVRKLLRKTTIDNKLAQIITGKKKSADLPVEKIISKCVFYLIMLFILVGFFEAMGLTLIAQPLNRFITQMTDYAPRLLGAGVLLLSAWFIASIVRRVVVGLLETAGIDEKISSTGGFETSISIAHTISEVAYWMIFLFFLPGILDALALKGLLDPVQSMINKGMQFIPNVFAAGMVMAAGWFIARIVQRITSNVLAAFGVDALSKKVGLSKALGRQKLSTVLGMVVYVLIMLPVLIAALDALSLDALTRPVSNMLNDILAALPNIFAALFLMSISYVVAKVAAAWAANMLSAMGFDNILSKLGLKKQPTEGSRKPSETAGYLVLLAIMVFASIEALNLIGFIKLAEMLAGFTVFAGQIVFGLIVFAIGIYFANIASQIILDSGMKDGQMLATIARASILVLTGAMALNRMGIANDIINMAFGLLLGSLAVAFALAFGLGGRDIAAGIMQDWLKKRSK
ncbi:MAG: mechanosensitive ion channel [Candidatus Altiarchaeota archaeon]